MDVIQAQGLRGAHERSAAIDLAIQEVAGRLGTTATRVAVVALAAYGRREPTPRGDIDVLFLHTGTLEQPLVTREVCYPLWEQHVRLEPLVRSLSECAADARRSLSAAISLVDARLIAGDEALFADLTRQTLEPLRRDRVRLLRRLHADVEHRHASHASVTSSTSPDIVAGRGGLLDAALLRWLDPGETAPAAETAKPDGNHAEHQTGEGAAGSEVQDRQRLELATDLLLAVVSALEELTGDRAQRLPPPAVERVADTLGGVDPSSLMWSVRGHARWIAFQIDSVFAPRRHERQLGPYLELRRGRLSATRLPALEDMPSLGLRVANLAGFAPPDTRLMRWATGGSQSGQLAARTALIAGAARAVARAEGTRSDLGGSLARADVLDWTPAAVEQLWLLLRAADWRSFDFLDVTGLLVRYLPELERIWRVAGPDQTLDSHSFLALRRLHAWTDSSDPFADRVWRSLRQRDWVYLAVLLHELNPAEAIATALRLGISPESARGIGFAATQHALLVQAAARRDPHDEDALAELAGVIGTPQRLRQLLLVGMAHELALDEAFASSWRADLMRRLFSSLDALVRRGGEVGPRRSRSVEHHRLRIVAELQRRHLDELAPVVARLPRRYVLARTPAFAARHLRLLVGEPLRDGEVRLEAHRPSRAASDAWDVLIVARDRPGLLATFAGVLALRGASVVAADAATCSDGLVLDVFTVNSAYGLPLERALWPRVAADLEAALNGRLPLHDLLGTPVAGDGVEVRVDNAESQVFSLVEVRAPDQVGLLYRIANALHALRLDIHHARITTPPEGALDVFYVWDLEGNKLQHPEATARELAARLGGERQEQSVGHARA